MDSVEMATSPAYVSKAVTNSLWGSNERSYLAP